MIIGIHAKGAFQKERTGVEEYVYQLIKHLTMLDESADHKFKLYTPTNSETDLYLPPNFKTEKLFSPFFWTKARLSLKMIFNSPDVLFMPANFLPVFYPKKNVVTIHGVEFEYFPEAYSAPMLKHLKTGTKKIVEEATKIIAVSHATKNDLIRFYNADPKKITVIHHGVNSQIAFHHHYPPLDEKYILYVGRLEKRKNVHNIVKAFIILKEKFKIPHKLVLVGSRGYGFTEINNEIESTGHKEDVVLTGYISGEEKESFIKYADVLVFPTLYEGFGMPILEAQIRETPVVTSNIPSIIEIAGAGALLIDPLSVEELHSSIYKIISDKNFKNDLIAKGLSNIQRFSWLKCAQQTLEVLTRD